MEFLLVIFGLAFVLGGLIFTWRVLAALFRWLFRISKPQDPLEARREQLQVVADVLGPRTPDDVRVELLALGGFCVEPVEEPYPIFTDFDADKGGLSKLRQRLEAPVEAPTLSLAKEVEPEPDEVEATAGEAPTSEPTEAEGHTHINDEIDDDELELGDAVGGVLVPIDDAPLRPDAEVEAALQAAKRPSRLSALLSFENIIFLLSAVLILGGTLYVAATTWGRVPNRWQFVFLDGTVAFYATLLLGAGAFLNHRLKLRAPARFLTFIAAGVAPICGLIARAAFTDEIGAGLTATLITAGFAAFAGRRLARLGEPARVWPLFTLAIAGLALSGLHPLALPASVGLCVYLTRDEAHLPLLGLLGVVPLLSLLPMGGGLVWIGPSLAMLALWAYPLRAYRWSVWAAFALFAVPAAFLTVYSGGSLGAFAWVILLGEVAMLRLLIDPDEMRKGPLWIAAIGALILAFTWTGATSVLVPEAWRLAALDWIRGDSPTIPPAWGGLSSVPIVLLGLWATSKLSTKDPRRRFSLSTAALISVIAALLSLSSARLTPGYAAGFIAAHALVWHLWTARSEVGRVGAHVLWLSAAGALAFLFAGELWALTAAVASILLLTIAGAPGRKLNAALAPLLIWTALLQGAPGLLCAALLLAYGLIALTQPIAPKLARVVGLGPLALYWALTLALFTLWPALSWGLGLTLGLLPFVAWLGWRRGPEFLLVEVGLGAAALYAYGLGSGLPGHAPLATLNALLLFAALAFSRKLNEGFALAIGFALWAPPFLCEIPWAPPILLLVVTLYWGIWAWREDRREGATRADRRFLWGVAQAGLITMAATGAHALSVAQIGFSDLWFALVGALALGVLALGGHSGRWIGLLGAGLILGGFLNQARFIDRNLPEITLISLGLGVLLFWQPRGDDAKPLRWLALPALLLGWGYAIVMGFELDENFFAPVTVGGLLIGVAVARRRRLPDFLRLEIRVGVGLAALITLLTPLDWGRPLWVFIAASAAGFIGFGLINDAEGTVARGPRRVQWGVAQAVSLGAALALAFQLSTSGLAPADLLVCVVGLMALGVLALCGYPGRWVGAIYAGLMILLLLVDARASDPNLAELLALSLGLGALLLWQPRGDRAPALVWWALPALLLGWSYGLITGLSLDEGFSTPVIVVGLLVALGWQLWRGAPCPVRLEVRWGLLLGAAVTLLLPLDGAHPRWIFALIGALGFIGFVAALEREAHPKAAGGWSLLALALPFAAALLGPLLTWPGAATALLCGLALLPVSKRRGGVAQAALALLLVFIGAEWTLLAVAKLLSTGRGAAHVLPALAIVALLWGVFCAYSDRLGAVSAPLKARAERSSLLIATAALAAFGFEVTAPSGSDLPLTIAGLVGLTVQSVRIAFRQRLGWSLYLAEASAFALYAWLRARTDLLDGFADYDGVFLVVMAFVLAASARWLRRKQRGFGPHHLDLTASLLPLLLPVVMEWDRSLAALGPLAATFLYAWIGRSQRRVGFIWLAALVLNLALIPILLAYEVTAPSAWLMPAGFTLLFMAQHYREEMPVAAPRLRSVAALLLLAGGAWETLTTGGVWPAVLLGAVSIGGVLLGILWRVRAYLVLGFGFLLLDMGVNLTRWGMTDRLIGGTLALLAGVGLFALGAVVAAHKERLLAQYRDLQSWEW